MYITEVYIKHAVKNMFCFKCTGVEFYNFLPCCAVFVCFSWFLYLSPLRELASMLVFGDVAFVFLFKENEV